MTSLTLHRSWTSPTLRNAMVVREGFAWAHVVDAAALIVRPVVVTLGIAAAAVMWPAHAHADVTADSTTNVLNGVGIGNNGPVSTTIAGAGQSICPMLVQPGSQLATIAAQASGQSGLAPTIAGWVATMVIQSQCPGWMTSLSNGQVPAGLGALTNVAAPALGVPGAAAATPGGLQIPGL
ncbi:DUF732 domain-containing protein [Mycobacterium yunnanensis]|uniref:DUF732 domain-containing protein n=1 Tax=Mycobacterium yunnanensis TaxID=368477 RepID=A0A9X2ZDK9_9MYCO|nr:hypothetical protein [Mycobacterium yunnanensis]MCV7424847.1 DUF732 domain-containing protein [Mycobacterium yunnanensis]